MDNNDNKTAWQSIEYELPEHGQVVLAMNADKMDRQKNPVHNLDVAVFYNEWTDDKGRICENVFLSRGYPALSSEYTHWMPVLSVSNEEIFDKTYNQQ